MRPAFRLVPDFIIPHLNNSTYGAHLHWEDRENGSFKISRIHQSSEMWNEQCIEVYKAWSLKKKLWNNNDPKKITRAKHRLITALRRNPDIEVLRKESTYYRFRIIHNSVSGEKQAFPKVPLEGIQVFTAAKKNAEETQKYPDCPVKDEKYQMENNLDVANDQTGSSIFSIVQANMNPIYNTLSQSEFYDNNVQKILSIPNYLNEDFYTNEGNAEFSDKCCCDVLLDNYLCNQKCIWHGMPP